MKTRIVIFTFLIANISFCKIAIGQDSTIQVSKNTMYLETGLTYGLLANVNYERLLFQSEAVKFNLRVSGGVWFEYAQYPYGSISIPILFGRNERKFELGLGVAVYYKWDSYKRAIENWDRNETGSVIIVNQDPRPTKSEYLFYVPAFTIGYRRQKSTGGPVFRTGIGWPNGLYFSYGWSF